MARYYKPALNLNADDVWAAACAAQRMNGEYVKVRVTPEDKMTNRELVSSFLETPESITDSDRAQGQAVRQYYKGLTFKILRGVKLNEFENNAMLFANREVITSTLEVATIAALPSCWTRAVQRDQVENRVNQAQGGFVGKVGAKVKLSIEVLKSFYSQNWGIYYTTGVTKDDQVVFFGNKNQFKVGDTLDIEGTVKAHTENSTQLNRVKVF